MSVISTEIVIGSGLSPSSGKISVVEREVHRRCILVSTWDDQAVLLLTAALDLRYCRGLSGQIFALVDPLTEVVQLTHRGCACSRSGAEI